MVDCDDVYRVSTLRTRITCEYLLLCGTLPLIVVAPLVHFGRTWTRCDQRIARFRLYWLLQLGSEVYILK